MENDLKYQDNEESQRIEECINIKEKDLKLMEKLKTKKGIGAILAGILAVLSKFKFVLAIILGKLKFLAIIFTKLKVLLGILKLGKFISTFGSMAFAIVIDAKMYGIVFGIGFVLLLFAHEMGHYLMAKHSGINVSGPVFIPFVGALIQLREEIEDASTEAKLAIGGPLLGSIASLLCGGLYLITDKECYLALCYSGLFLNLFNLIPVHPLDGGRVAKAISPKIWFIGIPLMAYLMIKFFSIIMLIVLIHGIKEVYSYLKGNKAYTYI